MKTAAACLALLLGGVSAFVIPSLPTRVTRAQPLRSTLDNDSSDRKGFLQGLAGLGLALTAAMAAPPSPAQAANLAKVNSELATYGLPPILDVPSGFSPLVEVYGKIAGAKKERGTYVVQFAYPSLWVVSRPSVDKNGEEGTISAGDYQKGDSAAFFVGPAEGDLEAKLGDTIVRAITQKSQNVYQNFKVLKTTKGPTGSNGAQYYIVDYKYELQTGAGFTVDRKGVASVTQLKDSVLALWTATTDARFKKLGGELRAMADSFRVYDGVGQGQSN